MRWWVVVGIGACQAPEVGGECVPPKGDFGLVCSDGRILSCEEGIWVDRGPEWSPDDNFQDLSGTFCTCDELDQPVCTYDTLF